MIIPLRTDRIPKRKPIITEGLILINMMFYLTGLIGQALNTLDLQAIVDWGAFDPRNFKWWQLFSSLFMHDPSGVWHLAFNMLFLWVFGSAIEDRFGRIGFLSTYLLGGAVANLAHAMVDQNPVIGASGAIAGVTGAFLALSPRSHVIVLFLIGFSVFAVPSLWLIGLYFAIDVFRLIGGRGGNVAYMAHIAGYVYGFSLAFVLLATGIIRREESDVFFLLTQARRRAALRAANRGTPSGAWESATADTGKRLERAKEQHETSPQDIRIAETRAEINRRASENDLAGAAQQYKTLLREAPDTVFTEHRQLELANQLYTSEDHAAAAAAYELFLDRYNRSGHATEIRLMLGVLYTRHLKHGARAKEVIEIARPLLRDPRQIALADDLLAELNRP